MVKSLLNKPKKLVSSADRLLSALDTYLNANNRKPTNKSEITGDYTGPAAIHLNRVEAMKLRITEIANQPQEPKSTKNLERFKKFRR